MKKLIYLLLFFALIHQEAYSQKTSVKNKSKSSVNQTKRVLKRKVAIARFTNETQSAKTPYYDKDNDPLGKQALDILSSKLANSHKFILFERNDLSKLLTESEQSGDSFQHIGAEYLIFGSITAYGRKTIGNTHIYSATKLQMVEATVSIRMVDVSTGLIIYSEEAKGVAKQKTRQALGIAGSSDYDATLSDKAISIAISKLVTSIINNCMDRAWKAYFLAYDNDAIYISGGKHQGIKVGDKYVVKQRRKEIKNPQNGLDVELPGQTIGEITVLSVGGDTPQHEFSTVTFTKGSIDRTNLANYYIEEKK